MVVSRDHGSRVVAITCSASDCYRKSPAPGFLSEGVPAALSPASYVLYRRNIGTFVVGFRLQIIICPASLGSASSDSVRTRKRTPAGPAQLHPTDS